MEQIGLLISKLKLQYEQGADPARLLAIIQLLQAEISKTQPAPPTRVLGTSKVAVVMPAGISPEHEKYIPKSRPEPTTTKKESVLVEDGSVAIVKDNGQLDMVFDPMVEIPTLSQQVQQAPPPKNAAEPESLNDKLKQGRTEILEVLKETPVKDLRKAIGINDRFLFIEELFRGDEAMYERSIKTINGFNIYPEAEYWITRELKTKLGWNGDNKTVLHFDQIVRRRFS